MFIGNLSYQTSAQTLNEVFSKYGEIVDLYRPEGKGFAFITFADEAHAQAAIDEMNGKELDGREIVVNVARPKEDRPRRSFGGGGRREDGFGGKRREYGNRDGGYQKRY